MKSMHIGVLAAAFIMTTYLLFFAGSAEVTNYPSSGKTIVAFGDSLVEGVGSTLGKDFVSNLSKGIGEPIINLGKSGDTTVDGLARLDEVLKENPKIVLLLLGGNDYIRKIPREETFLNLGRIIKSIHESGSIVILLGVRGGVLKDGYKDEFEDIAKQYGTAFVPDVLDGVFAHPDLMSDTIHPNDRGYEIISNKIQPVLNELLIE